MAKWESKLVDTFRRIQIIAIILKKEVMLVMFCRYKYGTDKCTHVYCASLRLHGYSSKKSQLYTHTKIDTLLKANNFFITHLSEPILGGPCTYIYYIVSLQMERCLDTSRVQAPIDACGAKFWEQWLSPPRKYIRDQVPTRVSNETETGVSVSWESNSRSLAQQSSVLYRLI